MRSIRNSARELYSDPAAEALKGMKSLMKAEESTFGGFGHPSA